MKKKFLSLMMAAAVVATTSVSAFADTDVISDGGKASVTINGTVVNSSGQAPAGTIKVTIPTAASFTVNQQGELIVPKQITVRNGGEESVDIFADSFTDTNKDGGITVVSESVLKTNDKTHVSLKVNGKSGTVFLGSEQGSKKGLYSKSDLSAQTGPFLLSSLDSGEEDNLQLSGNAGVANESLDADVTKNGVRDRFTLVLRIAKTSKAGE